MTWTRWTRPSRRAYPTRRAGGLTTRQALSVIHAIACPIVGADVVEMNPARDPLQITAYATAKVVKEIAGMMLTNSPNR